MEWSGTAWAFFPHYILDGFVVSKWVPQYTTEQFVVLLRYNRYCEPVPNTYWPKHLGLNIYYQFENVSVQESNLWSPAPKYLTLHTRPLPHMSHLFPPPPLHTHTGCKQQPKTFSALYCGSIPASRMLNQRSLCFNTETWCLRINTNVFVSFHKHYFSQILD